VGRVGVAGLVTAILFLWQAGYYVYGSTYKEALAQRDEWKAIALKAQVQAEATSRSRPIAIAKTADDSQGAAGLPEVLRPRLRGRREVRLRVVPRREVRRP
jgi:hypothetical protein